LKRTNAYTPKTTNKTFFYWKATQNLVVLKAMTSPPSYSNK